MINLLMKRQAWLRAVRILATCCALFTLTLQQSEAQECACSTDFVNCNGGWSEERKEILTLAALPGCPVIVTYKVRYCEYKVGRDYFTAEEICNTYFV